MAWRNSKERYGSLAIALHWLMLIVLALVVALMELRDLFPKGSEPRDAMKAGHYMFGLLVLALVLVRVGVRLIGPAPQPVPGPAWQHWLAALVQAGLYLVMLGMPLVGWMLLSAGGEAVPFFGVELPALFGPDKVLADTLEEVHETGANAAYVLAGVHTVAALYHHYVMRDDALRRMLPPR